MLKKILQKLGCFCGAFIELYETACGILGTLEMFGGISPAVTFFVIFCFMSVLIVPIYGLFCLYEWLFSLF